METSQIRYINGIPGLKPNKGCTLIIDEESLKVKRYFKIRAEIKIKDIMQVESKKETEFIPGKEKDKSVIGRAIGGGLLLGPVGAMVGGMSGVGKKTIEESSSKENWYIVIAYKLDGVQNIAIFRSEALFLKERLANKIVNELVTNRQKVLSDLNKKQGIKKLDQTLKNIKDKSDSIQEENEIKGKSIENSLSVEEKLKILKNLYDNELISEKEYIEKKKELLSSL